MTDSAVFHDSSTGDFRDAAGAITSFPGAGGGGYIGFVILQDQKTAGTAGGTSTSGSWETRTLNTEVLDTNGDCSLSSDQFTLAAGTYDIVAHAPAFVSNQHQIRLRNVTDGATILTGTGEYNDTSVANQTHSFLRGRFTIGASKALELQHRVAASRSGNGHGVAGNFGETEVYATVELYRVS